MQVNVQLISSNGFIPTLTDAGYSLKASDYAVIGRYSSNIVQTDLKVYIPEGYAVALFPAPEMIDRGLTTTVRTFHPRGEGTELFVNVTNVTQFNQVINKGNVVGMFRLIASPTISLQQLESCGQE